MNYRWYMGKKATDSSEIKSNDDSISYSNDSIHFDFSDRSSEPSTNDLQTCDSSVECSRPNQSYHDFTDSISSVSAPASESRDTIIIDCDRQEDFPSVCSIKTDVKSSKTLCNKFGSFNKESYFRKHKSVASKSCYVFGSFLHLIKDCDLHEQRFAKRNAKGKGILGRRSTGKPVNPNRPKPVSAGQPNPVSAGHPNTVSAGDGILGPLPLNIQPKNFPLPDPSMVILSIPIKHNLYTFRLNELAPKGPLTCLIAKASQDESTLWHRRLGHVNFRNMNKLVKVATACYVLNRVLVTKPHHKTPYELLTRDKPSISYLKPFGCHVTILNTSDPLGKFDKKSDEVYIVGYSISSKAYKVYNLVSRKIEETMNLNFLENKHFVPKVQHPLMQVLRKMIQTQMMNQMFSSYNLLLLQCTPQLSPCASPISADRHSSAAGKSHVSAGRPFSAGKPTGSAGRPVSAGRPTSYAGRPVSVGRVSVPAGRSSVPAGRILGKIFDCPKSGIFTFSSYDEDFSGPDANNLESSLNVVIGDINSHVHTRSQVNYKGSSKSTFISYIHDQRRNNHIDFQLCMFSCFLSQEELTTVAQALADPDWVEAMQAEMQQFRNQKVWVLVTLPDKNRP
nr:putative ribonuclease H-like domain-containing protein [Tanacetum cinerariifolium]